MCVDTWRSCKTRTHRELQEEDRNGSDRHLEDGSGREAHEGVLGWTGRHRKGRRGSSQLQKEESTHEPATTERKKTVRPRLTRVRAAAREWEEHSRMRKSRGGTFRGPRSRTRKVVDSRERRKRRTRTRDEEGILQAKRARREIEHCLAVVNKNGGRGS